MLPRKLRKRPFLSVNQNLSSVHFSLAKFQLVSSSLSLAMIWQMTYNHKLPKLCSATLILLEEKSFGSFDFFNWPLEGHVTLYQQNASSKIFPGSSIVACINFSAMPSKEKKI